MSVPETPPAAGEPDVPWYRVHPVSPLVRGWIAVVAIAYFWGQNWLENIFSRGQESDSDGGWHFTPDVLLTVVVGFGILLLIVLGFFLSWYFTRYQITERHVNVNSGIVFRQQRQARIDRVQAIDIAQPLLARMFGLAELKFEVADAGETAMSLAFLKLDDAKRLRNAILARAAGLKSQPARSAEPEVAYPADAAPTEGAPEGVVVSGGPARQEPARPHGGLRPEPLPFDEPEAPETVVAVVPPGRLIGSVLLSPWVWITVLALIGGAIAMRVTDGGFSLLYLFPFFLGVVPAMWGQFNQGYNFRAGMSPDGLRLSYGLLDTRHQTVPPGRVQAVQVSQGIIWKAFGWHKVVVNVAGYGGAAGGDAALRSTLLPVGTRADVLSVLAVVLPDPGTDRPLELIDAGIAGSGPDCGFTNTPRGARLLAPLAWRRQGFAVTRTALFARSGVLVRRLIMVPHERTQGLVLSQGPLARRLGVCDVQLATTNGPIDPRVLQTDVESGRALFLEQADRAATARHLADRDHWLEGEPNA